MNRDQAVQQLEGAEGYSAGQIEALAGVGVVALDARSSERRKQVGVLSEEVHFRCDRCHTQWPNLRVDGEARRGWWKCPKGCTG